MKTVIADGDLGDERIVEPLNAAAPNPATKADFDPQRANARTFLGREQAAGEAP